MDLTVHLASQHGLVPQSAVNALLLWVLTSNTFALNDSAQASLKAKFKGQGPTPQAPQHLLKEASPVNHHLLTAQKDHLLPVSGADIVLICQPAGYCRQCLHTLSGWANT